VNQHIEATVFGHNAGNHGATCISLPDVARHEFCALTFKAWQLLRCISSAYYDFGACAEKALGNAAANALGATSDKHDTILEIGFLFHTLNLPIARVS
jgi:hypothetical protein